MTHNTGWWLDEYDHDRFWSRVNFHGGTAHESDPLATAAGECWEWTGASHHGGYGSFRLHGKMTPAYRISYLDGGRKNRIPEGYVIDHLCRNPACVNPEHLEPVTHKTNLARGLSTRWATTHCPSGHPYDEVNTNIVIREGKRIRYCRICTSASRHRSYLRRKAAAAA